MDRAALVGERVGRYRLEALLKRDGLGLVFRAADQFAAETVAARIIAPDTSDGSWFAERLLRELRAVTHLDHHGLLPYREVGAQGEVVYLIGPLPPETTLADRLGRPLPPAEVAALLRPVAEALDYLHDRRIIHRRVSPATILLRDDGSAVLAEAGLAEAVAEATLSGASPGDPRPEEAPYLAPEQLQGGLLDGRADLYALGAVLYEALTGLPPFRARSGESGAALLARLAVDTPPRPREVNSDLSSALEAVVLRAIARAPYDRFATGAALIAALDEALSPLDTAAPTPLVAPDTDISPALERDTGPDAPLPAATPDPRPTAGGGARATATLERPKTAARPTSPATDAALAPMRWPDPELAAAPSGETPSAPGVIDHAVQWWSELTGGSRLRLVVALVAVCAVGAFLVYRATQPGSDLRQGRYDHTATLLPDGRVLLVGGSGGKSSDTPGSELYDPVQHRSASVSSPTWGYSNGTAALLADGRVVTIGSMSVERYDPRTQTWQSLAGPRDVRLYGATAILPDGRMLLTGGIMFADLKNSTARADLYDPATNSWRTVAPMLQARDNHTATALPNGQILVAGGTDHATNRVVNTAEIYDPATNTWRATSAMNAWQAMHTATLLADGRVLLAGGVLSPMTAQLRAQIYDPATDTWQAAGSLSREHLYSAATRLADGRVVIVGGQTTNGTAVGSVEIYDPARNRWERGADLATPRVNHTATLLADGRVLVAGGQQYRDEALKSVEIIDPE